MKKARVKARRHIPAFVWLGTIAPPTSATVLFLTHAFSSPQYTPKLPTFPSFAQNATSFTEIKFLTWLAGRNAQIDSISIVCLTRTSRKNLRLFNLRTFGIVSTAFAWFRTSPLILPTLSQQFRTTLRRISAHAMNMSWPKRRPYQTSLIAFDFVTVVISGVQRKFNYFTMNYYLS